MNEIKVGSKCRYVGLDVRDEHEDYVLSSGERVDVVGMRDEDTHYARTFPFRVKRPGAENPIHFSVSRSELELLT